MNRSGWSVSWSSGSYFDPGEAASGSVSDKTAEVASSALTRDDLANLYIELYICISGSKASLGIRSTLLMRR